MTLISVNGHIADAETLGFPIHDAAYLYGFGCFETLRIVDGTPELWGPHLARLMASATFLDIEIPFSASELKDQFMTLRNRQKPGERLQACNIYLSAGDRKAGISSFSDVKVIMVIRPYTSSIQPEDPGVETFIQVEQAPRNLYSGHKLMSYLPSIMEQRRAAPRTPLLASVSGELYETPTASILGIKDDTLWVNDSPLVLPSVTAQFCVERWESWGYACKRTPFKVDDLAQFSEIFLVNAMGVTPVRSVDGYPGLTSGVQTKRFSALFQ